jgi:ketosteroid isomerase-like protein
MSKNVENARAMYAAFARGDIGTVFGALSSDIEYLHYGEVPWAGSFKGPEQVGQFFQLLAGTINFEKYEPTEFFEAGDTVIVTGRTAATVKATGARFDNNWVNVTTTRDGKLLRFVGYDTASIAGSRPGDGVQK